MQNWRIFQSQEARKKWKWSFGLVPLPVEITKLHVYQQRFSVNVWVGIINDYFMGSKFSIGVIN